MFMTLWLYRYSLTLFFEVNIQFYTVLYFISPQMFKDKLFIYDFGIQFQDSTNAFNLKNAFDLKFKYK